MHACARKITSLLLLVTLFASTVATPFQSAFAGVPADDLKQIEYKYYFRGRYQQAIESLQIFLARVDLTETDAMRAREVLAASFVLGGAPVMGKQMFAEMIAKQPAYPGPDPNVFKLEVVDAYAKARTEYAARDDRGDPAMNDSYVSLLEDGEEVSLKNAPPSSGRSSKSSDDRDKGAAVFPSDAAVATAGTPIYKKWWFYAGAAALLAGVGVAMGGGGGESPPPADSGGVTVGVIVH